MDWRPGLGKGAKKCKNTPTYVNSRKPQIHSKNIFFKSQLEDLLNP